MCCGVCACMHVCLCTMVWVNTAHMVRLNLNFELTQSGGTMLHQVSTSKNTKRSGSEEGAARRGQEVEVGCVE